MKPRSIFTSLAFCALAPGLQAATLYWDGGDSTANSLSDNATTTGLTWLGSGITAGNWDNGDTSVPLATWNPGDSAIFGGTAATQTVTAGTLTLGNLTFGATGDGSGITGTNYTISGGTLTLSDSSVITTNTDTTISSVLTGTGKALVKAGAATLTLTGSKTYTGGTTVSAGTLTLGTGGATGVIRGALAIESGAQVNADTNWSFGHGNGTCVSAIAITSGTLNFTGTNESGGTSASGITLTGATISGSRFDWFNGITNTPSLTTVASSTTTTISSGFRMRYATTNSLTLNVAQGSTGSGTDLLISGNITTNATNGIIKSGAGTAVLSGTNTYGGATTVNAGVLVVSGSLSTGAVTVNANGTFVANSSLSNSNVTVNTDGTLAGTGTVKSATIHGKVSPGGSTIGTLSVSNALNLNTGGTTVCQIDKTDNNLTSDLLVATTVNFGGTLEVTVTGAPLEAGDSFQLFDSPSITGAFSSYSLPVLPTGLSWELTDLAGQGRITVVNRTPTPLFNPPSGGYVGGRSVTITSDSGSTVYYTFTTDGSTPATPTSGSPGGTIGSGTATIVIPSDASYKIRAFATRPGYSDSLVAEADIETITTPTWIYAGGGNWSDPFNWQKSIIPDGADVTADLGTQTLDQDSTVSIDSARTLGSLVLGDQGNLYNWTLTGSPLTMAGTSPVISVANRTATISASVAGSAPVSKTGAGTLRLTGSANYTGATSVNAGRLILEAGTDDRFSSNANTANLAIASDATFEFKATATNVRFSSANNEITGAGTFEKTGTGTGYLANGSTRHQQFNLSAGGLIHVMEGRLSDFRTAGSNLGALTIDAGATAQQITADSSFGALNGAGTLANGNGRILTFGVGNGSGTFSGAITGGGTFRKLGSGSQALAGNSTATAAFTVEEGTLAANNTTGSATGSGAVTVMSAATLAGTGGIGGNVTIQIGGVIAPGNSGIGSLTLATGTLNGIYQCEIGATTSDRIAVSGALTGSPGAIIAISTVGTPIAAEYVIATYGSFGGVLPAVTGVPDGYSLDTNTAGVIKLVSGTPSGFQDWMDDFPSLGNLADRLPGADPDHDGIPNIVEFVLNGDPASGAVTNSPVITASGNNLVFTFTRRDDAASLNPSVEFATDLTGPWSKAQHGVNCTITVQPNGTDPDTVTVTIPKDANTRLFARLAVTQ